MNNPEIIKLPLLVTFPYSYGKPGERSTCGVYAYFKLGIDNQYKLCLFGSEFKTYIPNPIPSQPSISYEYLLQHDQYYIKKLRVGALITRLKITLNLKKNGLL